MEAYGYCLKTQSQSQSIIFTISYNQAFIGNGCVCEEEDALWRKVKDEKKWVLPRVDGVQILSVSVNTHYEDSFFFFFEEALQGFLLSVSMNTHYECLGKLFLENININVCNNALPLYILKTNCN